VDVYQVVLFDAYVHAYMPPLLLLNQMPLAYLYVGCLSSKAPYSSPVNAMVTGCLTVQLLLLLEGLGPFGTAGMVLEAVARTSAA